MPIRRQLAPTVGPKASSVTFQAGTLGGIGESIAVGRAVNIDGNVYVNCDNTFAPANDHGVLDHDVSLPDGTTVHNPMRVLADGPSCDVVFTLRRRPGMDDAAFADDAAAVTRDLGSLKLVLEQA